MRDSLNFKKNVFRGLYVLLIVLIISATSLGAEDALLKSIPSDCLFCVRINNFQSTLGQVDQFMMGSGGMMGSATMIVQMSLAGVLGDPMLNGVDMNGNFGLYGASQGVEDFFVAFFIPVSSYEQLISGKSNYEAPDANKITKITTQNMGGGGSTMLMANVGNFAVITSEENYENLAALTKAPSSEGNLLSVLESSEASRASSEPIWAYGNMEQIAKVFGPVIKEGMEEAKAQMPTEMGDFSGAMDVYLELFDMLLNEVKFISSSLRAEPDALRINTKVATIPDTEMAGLFTASISAEKENNLLGYLEDGAIMNFGAKNHEGLLNKMSEVGMAFFNSVVGEEEIPEESTAKIETMMQDWMKAVGQDIAFSWLKPNGTSAFNFIYVLDVGDKEAFDRTIEDGMSIYDDAGIWDMYEEMGIKAGYEIQRGVDTYKGVSIDAAKFTMEATDTNSPEAQMINQMYKGGFIYRWAIVKDKWLCSIGEDADSKVRELIDSALTGSVKPMGAEMKAATGLIPGAEKADFVGTVNYIRILQTVTKMMPFFPIPVMDVPTKSNMVFAGKISSGQLVVDVVMPKEHMQEIMTMQQMMMQQMMQTPQQPVPSEQPEQ
jgi:hypothetical protein